MISLPYYLCELYYNQTKSVGPELDKHILKFGEANIHLAKKAKVTGLAAVFVSNCHSRSGRESVIREMKK